MKHTYDWTKCFVLPASDWIEHDIELINVLRNYLWALGSRKGPSGSRDVTVYKQHNRDIYYIVSGELDDKRTLDPDHLDQWEQDMIQLTTIDDVVDRLKVLDKVPSWWQESREKYENN